ncbi:MAG: nitroreductase/SAM-dependent methyltransferase [Planctomycetota bacterium]|jgi:nitroreductase/SAM-dependent methyltransferase
MAELPGKDFWEAIYERRSVRRFKPDPVPRELVDQVMHAGTWAPSSCNYQMWDLVAVDDPELNTRLAERSTQMGNAPVNIVVSYGRDFSEENYANIQSASALIQNMSLAAQVLGLGTFWITQTGGHDQVADMVGLPRDRMVVAVVALGYPAIMPKAGPKRRPLDQVTHYNHYAGRPIPSSTEPEDWEPDLLTSYQRARVLNGLRHNKPRAWEQRALIEALDALVPEGATKSAEGVERLRWLDVLPCTGILTERLSLSRPGFQVDIVERSAEVADWCARRAKPKGAPYLWDADSDRAPEPASYDLVSCLFRFEGLRAAERAQLAESLAQWVKPGGKLLLGFVSARSFHPWTERLRARRGGPGGVEYVLAPDPNVGPFQAIAPNELHELLTSAGFTRSGARGSQAAPQPEEIAFRTRNFSSRSQTLARGVAKVLGLLEKLPGINSDRGRFQFRSYTR